MADGKAGKADKVFSAMTEIWWKPRPGGSYDRKSNGVRKTFWMLNLATNILSFTAAEHRWELAECPQAHNLDNVIDEDGGLRFVRCEDPRPKR